MAKQTTQTARNNSRTATAKAAAQAAHGERETEAPATQGGVSGWARELHRAHSGESMRACGRWYKLADALAMQAAAAKPGTTVYLSFAKANELAGLRRGETGDAAQSWRLALQRTRQTFGGSFAAIGIASASVDAEHGRIAIEVAAQ